MAQRVDLTGAAIADDELARAAAAGDSTSFDELYRRHAEAAWRVAYAVTSNRDDAADAVAEAFTRVFTALTAGRLADMERFRPYLLATTRNAAIDVLRRGGRVRPVDELPHSEPGSVDSSDRLVDKLDASLVAAAFRSLPERWRSVLWLTEVEGLAPSEAAGLLGVSPNGAAQLAVRARAGLRQRYLQAHLRTEVHDDCRYTVERLGAYVGGGLAPRDIAKVDQHLAGCEECRARLAELEDLGGTLRRAVLPLPLALGALAWDHWHKVSTGTLAAHRARKVVSLPGQRALMGASVGLLGLGIIGATIVGQPPFGSGASRPAAAAPVGKPVVVQETAAKANPAAPALPIALAPPPAPVATPEPATAPPAQVAAPVASQPAPPVAPVNAPAASTTPLSSLPLPLPLPLGSGGGSTGGSTTPIAQVTTSADLAPAPTATVSAGAGTGSTVGASVGGAGVGSTPPTTTSPGVTVSVSTQATGTTSLNAPLP
ncbi:MAG TPA: sigma-70 family RNA polymerase sigma factor [Acidimicrobiales bacterium]|nr:sigma-70 family RNA polymerase sigma factor [Acidimicrobiales bacterium]